MHYSAVQCSNALFIPVGHRGGGGGGGGGASRTGDKREREVSQEGPLSEGESIK